ncbi:MAG: dihydroorotate dehydrogenase electron transfer subunit [Kiritimatiellae bacterium]|nr:dihydroorotate dehydrogenase electron transfer subunit [Kiritimatiellia bacterium]MDD4736049.1 dihydroorotate dehydrogenase electron transfer subunit [Kiritimatiellia bacterium]
MNTQLEKAIIIKNEPWTPEYYLLEFSAPGISQKAAPGQFVHVKIPDRRDILLRRPFSIFKAESGTLSILYKSVGRGTRHMAKLHAGQAVNLLGPLGKGFPIPDTNKKTLLVAGGYGMAALYLTAARAQTPGLLFAGGAGKKDILCAQDFTALGWDVRLATEDGSCGTHGLVTNILDAWQARNGKSSEPELFACGPMGMLKAVAQRAKEWNCTAWISLDHYMACGMGACLACVQKINRDGEERLACTCKEGPVFEAREIIWEES